MSPSCSKLLLIQIQMVETDNSKNDKAKISYTKKKKQIKRTNAKNVRSSPPCSKLLVIQIQMEETDNSKKDKDKKDTDKKDTNQMTSAKNVCPHLVLSCF